MKDGLYSLERLRVVFQIKTLAILQIKIYIYTWSSYKIISGISILNTKCHLNALEET